MHGLVNKIALIFACASAFFAMQAAHAGCEILFDPPRISDPCQNLNLSHPGGNEPWQTLRYDRAVKGLLANGAMAVHMTINSQNSNADAVIAKVLATRPLLGQLADTVAVNEDSSSWIDIVLHANGAAGSTHRQAYIEAIRYHYQGGQISAQSSVTSTTFNLQNSHAFELRYQFQNGSLNVSFVQAASVSALASASVLGSLQSTGFGETLPWLRVRSGPQTTETGLLAVSIISVP